MDAPPTQYRVIERDGRLIVLETRTNRPPKQAADLHPGRAPDRVPERVSVRDLIQGSAATKREAERTGRSTSSMQAPANRSGNTGTGNKVVKIPAMVFGLFVAAIVIGGFAGMAIAAGAILYAGYAALKTTNTGS